MLNLVEGIARSDKAQIEKLLKAVLQRYAQLFPDYEVSTISLKKGTDRNQQIDQIIALLQQMKTFDPDTATAYGSVK